MIRINLLGGERQKAKSAARFDVGQQLTALCGLLVVAAVGGVGFWYWSLSRQSAQLDAQILTKQREAARLDTVLAEVKTFEDRKTTLQQRVTLIEQLRRGQTAPVHVIDEIAKALPERTWLSEMVQKGSDVTLAGMTTSNMGVSDFVANLEASGWFKKPVDIIGTQTDSDPKTGDLVKFEIRGTVNNPDAPPPPVTPAKK